MAILIFLDCHVAYAPRNDKESKGVNRDENYYIINNIPIGNANAGRITSSSEIK